MYKGIITIKGTGSIAPTRWKVRQAVSVQAALDSIAHARVTGSIGDSCTVDERAIGGTIRIVADVVQVNSDGTERKPYTDVY